MAYFNEDGNIVEVTPEQEGEEDQSPLEALTLKRHGRGVQVTYRNESTILSKYEGEWSKDEMHGSCVISYHDGSIYLGGLQEGRKHGMGKYIWNNQDYYEGSWRLDKMHGHGLFKKAGSTPLEGIFRKNYYDLGGGVYISPFQSHEEIEAELEHRSKYSISKTIANKVKK